MILELLRSPSPVESDTVQTPCVDHPDHYEALRLENCQIYRPHTRSRGQQSSKKFASRSRHQRSPYLDPLDLSPGGNHAGFVPFARVSPLHYGSRMSETDIVRSFSDAFIVDDGRSGFDPPPSPVTSPCPPEDPRIIQDEQSDLDSGTKINARFYSRNFPPHHGLNPEFVGIYALGDELGSGGYGFVMTALHRTEGHEVAVKFIIKEKVPDHAWMENDTIGRLPTEVILLSFIDHENIVKCLDIFEDSLYFYLVQELHGSPWHKTQKTPATPAKPIPVSCLSFSPGCPTPMLSPSASISSLDSSVRSNSPRSPLPLNEHPEIPRKLAYENENRLRVTTLPNLDALDPTAIPRPQFSRRASHDLFECIEQSEHKRLSEDQARYVFSQVVDAVHFLDSHGIAHRDIKDENLVIDKNLKVKLIDFGSAAVVDPCEPRPYYNDFYGTVEYAASEILLQQRYQAAPAEIWTLGVLLSYLLTGTPPFLTKEDATDGKIAFASSTCAKLSQAAIELMSACLDPDVLTRPTIGEVKVHHWLTQKHKHK